MTDDSSLRNQKRTSNHQPPEADDGDLTDLLGELRVLLPGAQTLTAFLIILPFQTSFIDIRDTEKTVYMITFLCAVASLVCFTAPAAHHRLQRPLRNRDEFKDRATHLIIIGLVPLSVAIILATQLVTAAVLTTQWVSWLVAGLVGAMILFLWWMVPMREDRQARESRDHVSTMT